MPRHVTTYCWAKDGHVKLSAEGNFEVVSRYAISKMLQFFQTLVIYLPLMLVSCSFFIRLTLTEYLEISQQRLNALSSTQSDRL